MMKALPILLQFLANFACGQDITRIETDAAAVLRSLPGVESVQLRHAAPVPTRRIIHVLNYHFVARNDYAADLRDEVPETTDEEIDENHALLVAIVKDVQASQKLLLRQLIDKHGVRGVHLEGISDENHRIVEAVTATEEQQKDPAATAGRHR